MEKEITGKESLEIITKMISEAKRNVAKGGSFYFLLWGFVVSIANLGHYILGKYTDYPTPYFVWLVTIPAVLVTVIHSYRQGKSARVHGPLDKLHGHIWIAAFVGILMALIFMNKIAYHHNPIILLIAGSSTYLTGILLKFRPLIIGGICLWVMSVICYFLPVIDQYLAGCVGIIIGYIIPGFMLKKAESE